MKGIRALLVLLVVGSVVTAVAWSAVTREARDRTNPGVHAVGSHGGANGQLDDRAR